MKYLKESFKGLKDKSIKELCSKPLMAYSIKAAIKFGIFDEIHVLTDSKEYVEIAISYGAANFLFEDNAIYKEGCYVFCPFTRRRFGYMERRCV